jgi:toxin HigB-1
MWTVYEHRRVEKQYGALPVEIRKRYEKWKDVVEITGPAGLRRIRGFRDEALSGEWRGWRSSRLDLQYRVIYRVYGRQFVVQVVSITAHDYRRK